MRILDLAAIATRDDKMLSADGRLWRKMRNGMPACIICGCKGNMECGHEPLGAPEHNCELSPTLECYCCLIKAGRKFTKQGHVLPEVMNG